MRTGDLAFVQYANGKTYNGKIVSVRDMPNNRTLFTVCHYTLQDVVVKYSSLYLDKCESCEVISAD